MSGWGESAVAPAGWHDDPWETGLLRWWDGQQWTAYTAPYPRGTYPPTSSYRADWSLIRIVVVCLITAPLFAIVAAPAFHAHDTALEVVISVALASIAGLVVYRLTVPAYKVNIADGELFWRPILGRRRAVSLDSIVEIRGVRSRGRAPERWQVFYLRDGRRIRVYTTQDFAGFAAFFCRLRPTVPVQLAPFSGLVRP